MSLPRSRAIGRANEKELNYVNSDLNAVFQSWLDDVFAHHKDIVEQELGNRFDVYWSLQECFTSRPIDVACLRERARNPDVTATNNLLQHARTKYDRLLDDSSRTQHQVAQLIDYLPDSPRDMEARIDEFVALGKERSDLSPGDVLVIASLALTLAHPTRFVDFPSESTWKRFAQTLGYGVLNGRSSHGEKLMWASTFAQALTHTEAFDQRWARKGEHAMWVISALNWTYKLVTANESGETG